ncbi:heme biosynthesis HemY N-terminal domain-containing protein [Aquabacterium sp.]|uniref:heme biosynthesis HemY N-terminal domain-containing protein n=1 Tax=Aquabacterium sp. TaxID=1872578 RepID=UPI0035B19E99
MRVVVWLLLIAIVAVVAAGTLGANDGLVSLYWSGWRVDLSLNFFLIGLLLICLALYSIVQTLDSLLGLPRRAQRWRVSRRDRVGQAALREALAQLLAGRYSRAHKMAQRAITIQAQTPEIEADPEFTALGHLLSASSLHRLQDRPRRDEHLSLALANARRKRGTSPSEEAAQLLAAEWAIDDRRAEQALSDLSAMPPGLGRRTQALRLRLQAARLANQPLEALRTARLLAKHGGISSTAAEGLLRTLAMAALDAARDADQLRQQWQQLDGADRKDPYVAAHAVTLIGQFGAPDDGRAWLRPFWDRLGSLSAEERAQLAQAMAHCVAGLPADWLPRLEGAHQTYPREPMVSYAVGRALAERQLWGKARRLLENAAQEPTLPAACRRDAWLFLATLADQEQRPDDAADCYRRAARSL